LFFVKKILRHVSFGIFFLWLGLCGCSKEGVSRNPYLTKSSVDFTVNLNLPQYNALNFVGGSIHIDHLGWNGIILFNLNGEQFLAWEASCSNHALQECSQLSLTGVLAVCSCEGYQYSLATGQLLNPDEDMTPYSLLQYSAFVYGNSIQISN